MVKLPTVLHLPLIDSQFCHCLALHCRRHCCRCDHHRRRHCHLPRRDQIFVAVSNIFRETKKKTIFELFTTFSGDVPQIASFLLILIILILILNIVSTLSPNPCIPTNHKTTVSDLPTLPTRGRISVSTEFDETRLKSQPTRPPAVSQTGCFVNLLLDQVHLLIPP